MNKYLKSKSLVIIVLSMFFLIQNAFAKECYEKSAKLIQLKEKYFDLTSYKKIAQKDKDKLKKIYDKIKGNWKGRVTYTECEGPEKNPRKDIKTGKAKIKVKADRYLILKQKISLTKLGRNYIRTYKLLKDETVFTYEITDENNLEFSEFFRKKNTGKIGTRLTEASYKITIKDGLLKVKIHYYVNGSLIGKEEWSVNSD